MKGRQMAEGPEGSVAPPVPLIIGRAAVRRTHFLRLPLYELSTDSGLRVGLGRYSSLGIYFFGRGQRILLPGGRTWRLTSIPRGSSLAAVVANEEGRRLAMATPGALAGRYGINGRDYAFTLNPGEAAFGRANRWDLTAGEELVARFSRRPSRAECLQPLPLPAVLLCLLLARFGIPGEADLRMPQLNWGTQK